MFFGDLGRTAGKHLSHLFGFGDYKVKSNVFLNGTLPQVYNMPSGGGTIIRYQEYLGDVITSDTANTFDVQSYIINPANQDTFPWLSQIAANYEQYSLEGLVFEFRSTSADALNSTNTALGTVMMATQYDVADAPFTSKAEMLNYEFSTSVKPSESCLHMIECAPRVSTLTELYTNAGGTQPAGTDPRFYNMGRFSIATTGFQGASVNVGELHCTYQVRLIKPKLFDTLGYDNWQASWLTGAVCGASAAFGVSTRVLQSSSLPAGFVSFPSNNSIRFEPIATAKRFLLSYTSIAVSSSSTFSVSLTSNIGGIPIGQGFISAPPTSGTNIPGSWAWDYTFETIPNEPCTITIATAYSPNNNSGVVRLIELPADGL